jgi:hypothetical protein
LDPDAPPLLVPVPPSALLVAFEPETPPHAGTAISVEIEANRTKMRFITSAALSKLHACSEGLD